ncbi:MAG: hypothetical protein QOJ97_1572 [Solirubrobacteraceae bacterium]|jgi:hypothetical protein|nr:hypothetical protein [Solirubrobacteraceae bacterium]
MAEPQPKPLAEYGVLIATFATLFSVGTAAARRQGRLPERVAAADVVLGGIATQKLSRLVAKDKVTSAVRAPFTEVERSGPNAEVEERPAGRGVRYAVGELLVCPFCLSQWIAAGFALGLMYAPRVTRLVMAMNAMVAISDFLQVAYRAAENRREPQ